MWNQRAGLYGARFGDNLQMGPQFDAIYLHWMLDLYSPDR